MDGAIKVVVAMSGGVDSSVVAALLKQQGYDVIGIMLHLWSDPGQTQDNRCCTPDAISIARKVAAHLSIPFYVLDARELFYDRVVRSFIEGYAQGATPNPCITCNYSIRWGFLLQQCIALNAHFLATGHYARLTRGEKGDLQLLRSKDLQKDQSYMLYRLGQEQLSQTRFPLGDMTKSEVRTLARQFGLLSAERPDSQDLCFLTNSDYREFLIKYAPGVLNSGPIITSGGQVLGKHQGLAFYTIGQRKGLGISSMRPLYVLGKDIVRNALIVGYAENLGQSRLIAEDVCWVSGSQPELPIHAQVKTRYTAKPEWADIYPYSNHRILIHFELPIRDITPGQAAVIYQSDICLGGGMISQNLIS